MKDLSMYLNKKIEVVIDRPLGSKHPTHEMKYPINYGYIKGTVSGDGKEIDVYVIDELEAIKYYSGQVVGIVHREDDVEDKLIVANHNGYLKEELYGFVEFTEQYFKSTITVNYEPVLFIHERLSMMYSLSDVLCRHLGSEAEIGYYNKNYVKLNGKHLLQTYNIPVITYKTLDIGFNIDCIFMEKFYSKTQIIELLKSIDIPYEYEIYGGENCRSFEGETLLNDISESNEKIIGLSIYIPYNDIHEIMTLIEQYF